MTKTTEQTPVATQLPMKKPNVSFEFFPPQTLDASFRLWETVQALAPLKPGFVSVTYGAGGTTRKLTHEAVATIHKNYGLNVAAHLTCVNATRAETMEIVDAYAAAGVTEIVALRGDPPKGAAGFAAHPEGFASSVKLIEALAQDGRFTIRCGAYPERHPDAADAQADVRWLKRKSDAGATSAITQFFFEADTFLRFRDACVAEGITAKLIPKSCRSSPGRARAALRSVAARISRHGSKPASNGPLPRGANRKPRSRSASTCAAA